MSLTKEHLNEYTLKDLKSIATKYKLEGRGKKRTKQEFIDYLLDQIKSKTHIDEDQLTAELKNFSKSRTSPNAARRKGKKSNVSRRSPSPKRKEITLENISESTSQNVSATQFKNYKFMIVMSKDVGQFIIDSLESIHDIEEFQTLLFRIHEDHLEFQIIDRDRFSLISIRIPKEHLETYDVIGENGFDFDFDVDLSVFYTVLFYNKPYKKYELILEKNDANEMQMTFMNKKMRQEYTFHIELTKHISLELPLSSENSFVFRFPSKEFHQRIKMFEELEAPSLKLSFGNDILQLYSKKGKIPAVIDYVVETETEKGKTPTKSDFLIQQEYSTNYLSILTENYKVDKKVLLTFEPELPLKLTYEVDKIGKLDVFLAPYTS